MEKIGFSIDWINLIMRCITLITYSVCLNGNKGPSFRSIRGLRQGNPLSPFIFLICSEGLSSLMRLVLQEGRLKRVKVSQHGPIIFYLLFVDDSILFGEASIKGVWILKELLQEYELNFGQCIKFENSTIFLVQIQGVHCKGEFRMNWGYKFRTIQKGTWVCRIW